jgi:exodeoxyribonuclease VII small subunit
LAKKKKKISRSDPTASFEEAMVELEEIVHDLEDGKIGLAEALNRYEQGVKLLKSCHQLLEKAERRIQLLSGVDAEGNPVVERFEDDESDDLDGKSAARARRRSQNPTTGKKTRSRAAGSDVDEGRSLF